MPIALSGYSEELYIGKDYPMWISGLDENKSSSLEALINSKIDAIASEDLDVSLLKENVYRIVGQCGEKCDKHVNCENEACHLLFIQCDSCNEKMQGCCSPDCQNIYNLSFEDQKALRKGTHNSNKIFKKGRSEVLKYKK